MKRVMIGGMRHESNMFNPVPTDLEAFKLRNTLYSDEIIEQRRKKRKRSDDDNGKDIKP